MNLSHDFDPHCVFCPPEMIRKRLEQDLCRDLNPYSVPCPPEMSPL